METTTENDTVQLFGSTTMTSSSRVYDIIVYKIYSDSLFYFDYDITGGPITTILKATEGRGQYNQRHDSRYDSRTGGIVLYILGFDPPKYSNIY